MEQNKYLMFSFSMSRYTDRYAKLAKVRKYNRNYQKKMHKINFGLDNYVSMYVIYQLLKSPIPYRLRF